jgi:hypothetical protein
MVEEMLEFGDCLISHSSLQSIPVTRGVKLSRALLWRAGSSRQGYRNLSLCIQELRGDAGHR